MTTSPKPVSEMVRLPADVVVVLRRRAASADVSLAEAARQLLLSRDLGGGQHGLLEHVAWLEARLRLRRDELGGVFSEAGADARRIPEAVKALARLKDEWPTNDIDDDEYYA